MSEGMGPVDSGIGTMGWAIACLRDGLQVRRMGWNGKGMYLYLHTAQPKAGNAVWQEFVVMKTADDTLVPWLCSQTDLLADDWEVAR